jgi:hypothetical protein
VTNLYTHSYLETLFWNAAKAMGARRPPESLEHEGHNISRRAVPQRSNSGKTVLRWSSKFFVTTPTGRIYTVDDSVALNRRNDPERNWGLGRD